MSLKLSRQQYAEHYGPTAGDQVRLGDTELIIEVERDLIAENGGYGNEVKFGGGKVIRDGMGQSSTALDSESLDVVITNALIIDADGEVTIICKPKKPTLPMPNPHQRINSRCGGGGGCCSGCSSRGS